MKVLDVKGSIDETKSFIIHNALLKLIEVTNSETAIFWKIDEDDNNPKLVEWSETEEVPNIKLDFANIIPEYVKYYSGEKIDEKTLLEKFNRVLEYEIKNAVFIPIFNEEHKCGYIQIVNINDFTKYSRSNKDVNCLISIIETVFSNRSSYRSMAKKIISLKNVKKTFYVGNLSVPVLKGISLDIYEGELIVILGASGSGKTTLLNILGGMDQLTEGRFYFEDKDYSCVSEAELTKYRRNSVGFIFQTYNLMPNLNAIDNLDFIAALCKNSLNSREVLNSVGMEEHMKKYPSQISGGQQHRVSIARALVKNPQIILADEPTAALDYTNSIEILKLLQGIVSKGSTLVMVTHNEEIAKMANRVIRIKDGVIQGIIENDKPELAQSLKW